MAIGHKERIKEGQKPTPTRARSKAQEDQVAKALGGQRQPNSGATMWAPGDVVAGKFLVECKTKMTDSKSISIQKEWFEKNTKEAVFRGLPYGIVAFNFGQNQKMYYIIDANLMIDFIDYMNARNEDC